LSRIFSGLAIFATVLLSINLFTGLSIGDWNDLAVELRIANRHVQELQRAGRGVDDAELRDALQQATAIASAATPMGRRATLHILLGIAAALVTVLVNSISVTYFIGTSRWCQEVVDTYQLNPEFTQQSLAMKRRSFPWSLGGILTILLIVALGAASDPGNRLANSAAYSTWHFAAAMLGIFFIGVSFFVQVTRIATNYQLINNVMSEVQRIRAERGLAHDS
jgi:hypothetical protein